MPVIIEISEYELGHAINIKGPDATPVEIMAGGAAFFDIAGIPAHMREFVIAQIAKGHGFDAEMRVHDIDEARTEAARLVGLLRKAKFDIEEELVEDAE